MVTIEELAAHLEKLREYVSGDASELRTIMWDWCHAYYKDAHDTAEGLVIEFSMGVGDCYLYGLMSCIASIHFERAGELPKLTDSDYESISMNLLRVRSEESQYTLDYFTSLEQEFAAQYPLTRLAMNQMANDVMRVNDVTKEEYEYGYYSGVEHAMSVFAEVIRS